MSFPSLTLVFYCWLEAGAAETAAPPFPQALAGAAISSERLSSPLDDALILGNGDLNALLWAEAGGLVLSLTKNDVWDARLDTSNDPPLPTLKRLLELGLAGGPIGDPILPAGTSWSGPDSYSAHGYPCPRACARVLLPWPENPPRLARLDLERAVAEVEGADFKVRVRALAGRNAVLVESPADLQLAPLRSADLPEAKRGETDGAAWIEQEIPGDLDWPGMRFAVALAAGGERKAVAVVTSREAAEVKQAAVELARSTALADPAILIRAHEEEWRRFWSASGLELAEPTLERAWYRSLYFLRCVTKPGAISPGLFAGLVNDTPAWHGDYHTNYNLQQTFWAAYPANHPELAEPYDRLILEYLPRARWLARQIFDLEGAYYPHVLFVYEPPPERCRSRNRRQYIHHTWGMTLGVAGFTVQPLWWHYLYAPSRDLLLQTAAPPLLAVARFYAGFIERDEGDGPVRLGPSVSPEHWGWTPKLERNWNGAFDLVMVRSTLEAASVCARLLGREAEAARFRRALDRLPPYPLHGRENPVVVDVEGAPPIQYNIAVPATPVFPGDVVTWQSPAAEKDLFARTVQSIDWNGNNSMVMLAVARARLSLPGTQEWLRREVELRLRPNGTLTLNRLQPHHPFNDFGHYTEQFAAAMAVSELLVQSAGGTIRLFPAVSPSCRASFSRFRTQGGFLVSASGRAGAVEEVKIESPAGGRLRLFSPWPKAALRRGAGGFQPAALGAEGIIGVETAPGDVLEFRPAAATASSGESGSAASLASRIEKARTRRFELSLRGPDGRALADLEVEVEQERHDFLFGGNLYAFDRFGDPFRNQAYKRHFEALFNYATLPFYWKDYEPERGKPGHAHTERLAEWCAARGIIMKGHPLVWTHPASVPSWIDPLPAEAVKDLLLARVRDCAGRFQDRIAWWDVINEPIHTAPFKGFTDRLEQLAAVYQAVREASPRARLVLNEYHVMSGKAPEFFPFVEEALKAGAPIDAIGIQAHEPRFCRFDPGFMEAVLDRYARFGKEIHLTEIVFTSGGQKVLEQQPDGSFKPAGETWTEALQAQAVEEFYRLAFAHPAVAAITWWDLADGHSWLPGGGLLREDLTPKPAYGILKRLIREEWWTRRKVRAEAAGRISFTGFFGEYKLRVKVGGIVLERAVQLGRDAPPMVEVEFPAVWSAGPEQAGGVFGEGEAAAFRMVGLGPPPRAKILEVSGREVAAPAFEASGEGKYRLAIPGLPPGHYRLVLEPKEAPAASRSFAVIPRRPEGLPSSGGAICSDAAISWLVAKRDGREPEVAAALRLARAAGLRLLRDRISWEETEPRPGEYRWGRYEAVAAACEAAGIGVYQIFHASPSWAREDRAHKRMPDDLRAGYRFARAAAERFRGRVIAWEPWNEPDIPVFCDDPADQVAAFQKAAYLGFKAADPEALVLLVSLAHPPGPFVESFLENETAPYFEAYNYHTYQPLEKYAEVAAAHAAARARFGAAAKPVWLTEAGIPLRTPSGELSFPDAIRQAEFLAKSYVLSLGHGTARHFFFIFPPYLENDVQFGLLEKELSPGPGYAVLGALTAALGDARRPRALRGLPPGASGWLFARGDSLEAAAVWAREKTALAVPSGLAVSDLWGHSVAPREGSIELVDRVAYFTGKPESFAAWKPEEPPAPADDPPAAFSLPQLVLRFVFPTVQADKGKEAWRVGEGGLLKGKLQAYNFSPRPFKGAVKISGEAGLEAVPAEKAIEIGPDGLAEFEVELRWREDGPTALRRARAVAIPEGASGERERSSAAVIRVLKE